MRNKMTSAFSNQRRIKLIAVLVIVAGLASCTGNSSQGLGVYPKAVGAADETSAIQALRTIATAEAQLKATQGTYGDFGALTQAGLLDERFAGAAPNLRGYRFTVQASDADFAVNADPQITETQPTTGSRHFYLDSTDNIVHVNPVQKAGRTDPSL